MNAQKFEGAFYASANPDLRTVRPPELPKPKEPEQLAAAPSLELAGLMAQLQKSPELASTLAALLLSLIHIWSGPGSTRASTTCSTG